MITFANSSLYEQLAHSESIGEWDIVGVISPYGGYAVRAGSEDKNPRIRTYSGVPSLLSDIARNLRVQGYTHYIGVVTNGADDLREQLLLLGFSTEQVGTHQIEFLWKKMDVPHYHIE